MCVHYHYLIETRSSGVGSMFTFNMWYVICKYKQIKIHHSHYIKHPPSHLAFSKWKIYFHISLHNRRAQWACLLNIHQSEPQICWKKCPMTIANLQAWVHPSCNVLWRRTCIELQSEATRLMRSWQLACYLSSSKKMRAEGNFKPKLWYRCNTPPAALMKPTLTKVKVWVWYGKLWPIQAHEWVIYGMVRTS